MLSMKKVLSKILGSLTVTSGTLTKVSTNISNVENASWVKYGNVCILRLTFTVGTTISNSTETLFSNLPEAYGFIRETILKANASSGGVMARIEVNGTTLRNAYTSGGIAAAQYEGEIVYITKN